MSGDEATEPSQASEASDHPGLDTEGGEPASLLKVDRKHVEELLDCLDADGSGDLDFDEVKELFADLIGIESDEIPEALSLTLSLTLSHSSHMSCMNVSLNLNLLENEWFNCGSMVGASR